MAENENALVETFPEERYTVEIPEELMDKYGKSWGSNKVTFRTLGIGESMRISDQALSVNAKQDKTAKVQYNREIAVVDTINRSVVEAPWKVNDKLVAARIPKPLAEWLLEVIENGGGLDEKKKPN